jgi:serine/threonine-protein kinase
MIAGKYVLDRLLGQGGMGAVFAAKHIKLSKAVAIKIMLADASNPEAAQRFINEGRAAANIQNEHVVRVDDVDEEMGYAYMVLELLDGEDLSQVLEKEPAHRLPYHVAVGYVLQALRGVMQAHAIGIVHRDLKPSNLFLARRKDGTIVVKVLDFGISKAQGSSALAASPSALTSTKAMLGSPLYMSPEQLRSSKSVDHRADIWAMGIILYELMTGHLPFMGDNLGELFAAILETDPAPIRSHADDVPPVLEEIVLRCLQRKPENRFQSAADLAHALAPFTNAQAGFIPHLPNIPLTGGTVAMPPPGSAVTPSTPMQRPQLPPGAAGTGSGPQQIAGTVAIGQVTPQPGATPQPGFLQTGNGGWQSTGSGGAAVPKSKLPLILGAAFGGLALLGVVIIGLILMLAKKPEPVTATSASAPPPPASIVVPATVETTPAPTPAPTETAPPPASATASASAAAQPVVAHKHHTTQPTPPKPAVDPPKTVTPPAPTPAKTTPKSTSGGPLETR